MRPPAAQALVIAAYTSTSNAGLKLSVGIARGKLDDPSCMVKAAEQARYM